MMFGIKDFLVWDEKLEKMLYLCTQNRVRSLAAPQQFNELIALTVSTSNATRQSSCEHDFALAAYEVRFAQTLSAGKSKSVAECQCMRREKRLLEALQVKWQ